MEKLSLQFLISFHKVMLMAAAVFSAVAVIAYFSYLVNLRSKSSLQQKYDYMATYEIQRLKLVFLFIAFVSFFLINLYGQEVWEMLGASWLAFSVRVFIAFAGSTLLYYIAALILDYYYPHRLSRKLKALRSKPRINPKTGNEMRLLREDEEDVHLDEGMQAEENIFSVDYDVWLDEQTGDTLIERYEGHKVAVRCNNCGYITMRVFKEEISAKDSNGVPVEIVKHYQCIYCKNLRATAFNVSRLDINDIKNNLSKYRTVDGVGVSIIGKEGKQQSYEFKSMKEAKKFLSDKAE